ncbi:MAG: serine/threonine-protein phosphatase [Myxococcales bacterium]|nr:serine/threonine-protein phosphatase [Myxococcales bacterium]
MPTSPRVMTDRALEVDASGKTDVGLLRSENQDCIFVDQAQGFYVVLDGMGGHQGGATASRVARDVMVETIAQGRETWPPGKLLVEACKAAGSAVHLQARADRELHGMGTTVVALAMPRVNQALIAHVGDSRAYLLRKGRLRRLTADHTIVAELVSAGKLTPEQAIDHPHASVLSRNLGGLQTTEVDLLEVELEEADRLLLCSDGLNGYATRNAIEQVLSGAATPEEATTDLIELAKRGGGGDNISAVVVEIGRASSELPETIEETGAGAWWSRRPLFMEVCRSMGLGTSPLASSLTEADALDLLGGSFCEAMYLDLEGTTGIHIWTYADSLVKAWFERDGRYGPVKELFDVLRAAALSVAKDVSRSDEDLGVCLEIALLRALIVGEMVVGGQISECIKVANETFASRRVTTDLPDATFANVATVPFSPTESPMPVGPEVNKCLADGAGAAKEQLGGDEYLMLHAIIDAAHSSASEFCGEADMSAAAIDLYGTRLLTEQEINPLLDGLETARVAHLAAVDALQVSPVARATALCALALAHQSLFHAFALVAVDAGKPTTDRLREMNASTSLMRARLERNEQHLAHFEVDIDTVEDLQS